MRTTFENLDRMIGHTPMVGIDYQYNGNAGTVYAKCEYYNLSGSIKDRMALSILQKAYKNGEISPDSTIVEATSGNAGISFAALGRMLGHKIHIIMPDWVSRERKLLLESYGAEVQLVSKEEGGFMETVRISQEMAENDPKVFLPCQFANYNNVKAHEETTGTEILTQLKGEGLSPDAFVAGIGTGGTVVGVGNAIRAVNKDAKIHPLEPEESPILLTGHKKGCHRIQGLSDGFIPEIVDLSTLDDVVDVSDGDAILMAQKLSSSLGLGVGISSGANMVGAIKLQEKYGFKTVVATVFADCNKKYLSTDLMKEEPVKDHHISPNVELLDFFVLKRAF